MQIKTRIKSTRSELDAFPEYILNTINDLETLTLDNDLRQSVKKLKTLLILLKDKRFIDLIQKKSKSEPREEKISWKKGPEIDTDIIKSENQSSKRPLSTTEESKKFKLDPKAAESHPQFFSYNLLCTLIEIMKKVNSEHNDLAVSLGKELLNVYKVHNPSEFCWLFAHLLAYFKESTESLSNVKYEPNFKNSLISISEHSFGNGAFNKKLPYDYSQLFRPRDCTEQEICGVFRVLYGVLADDVFDLYRQDLLEIIFMGVSYCTRLIYLKLLSELLGVPAFKDVLLENRNNIYSLFVDLSSRYSKNMLIDINRLEFEKTYLQCYKAFKVEIGNDIQFDQTHCRIIINTLEALVENYPSITDFWNCLRDISRLAVPKDSENAPVRLLAQYKYCTPVSNEFLFPITELCVYWAPSKRILVPDTFAALSNSLVEIISKQKMELQKDFRTFDMAGFYDTISRSHKGMKWTSIEQSLLAYVNVYFTKFLLELKETWPSLVDVLSLLECAHVYCFDETLHALNPGTWNKIDNLLNGLLNSLLQKLADCLEGDKSLFPSLETVENLYSCFSNFATFLNASNSSSSTALNSFFILPWALLLDHPNDCKNFEVPYSKAKSTIEHFPGAMPYSVLIKCKQLLTAKKVVLSTLEGFKRMSIANISAPNSDDFFTVLNGVTIFGLNSKEKYLVESVCKKVPWFLMCPKFYYGDANLDQLFKLLKFKGINKLEVLSGILCSLSNIHVGANVLCLSSQSQKILCTTCDTDIFEMPGSKCNLIQPVASTLKSPFQLPIDMIESYLKNCLSEIHIGSSVVSYLQRVLNHLYPLNLSLPLPNQFLNIFIHLASNPDPSLRLYGYNGLAFLSLKQNVKDNSSSNIRAILGALDEIVKPGDLPTSLSIMDYITKISNELEPDELALSIDFLIKKFSLIDTCGEHSLICKIAQARRMELKTLVSKVLPKLSQSLILDINSDFRNFRVLAKAIKNSLNSLLTEVVPIVVPKLFCLEKYTEIETLFNKSQDTGKSIPLVKALKGCIVEIATFIFINSEYRHKFADLITQLGEVGKVKVETFTVVFTRVLPRIFVKFCGSDTQKDELWQSVCYVIHNIKDCTFAENYWLETSHTQSMVIEYFNKDLPRYLNLFTQLMSNSDWLQVSEEDVLLAVAHLISLVKGKCRVVIPQIFNFINYGLTRPYLYKATTQICTNLVKVLDEPAKAAISIQCVISLLHLHSKSECPALHIKILDSIEALFTSVDVQKKIAPILNIQYILTKLDPRNERNWEQIIINSEYTITSLDLNERLDMFSSILGGSSSLICRFVLGTLEDFTIENFGHTSRYIKFKGSDPVVKLVGVLANLFTRFTQEADSLLLSKAVRCIGIIGAVDYKVVDTANAFKKRPQFDYLKPKSQEDFSHYLLFEFLIPEYFNCATREQFLGYSYCIQALFEKYSINITTLRKYIGDVGLQLSDQSSFYLEIIDLNQQAFKDNLKLNSADYATYPLVHSQRLNFDAYVKHLTYKLIVNLSADANVKVFDSYKQNVYFCSKMASQIFNEVVLTVILTNNEKLLANLREEFISVLEFGVDVAETELSNSDLCTLRLIMDAIDYLNKWALNRECYLSTSIHMHSGSKEWKEFEKFATFLATIPLDSAIKCSLKTQNYFRVIWYLESKVKAGIRAGHANLINEYNHLHNFYGKVGDYESQRKVPIQNKDPLKEFECLDYSKDALTALSYLKAQLVESGSTEAFRTNLMGFMNKIGVQIPLSSLGTTKNSPPKEKRTDIFSNFPTVCTNSSYGLDTTLNCKFDGVISKLFTSLVGTHECDVKILLEDEFKSLVARTELNTSLYSTNYKLFVEAHLIFDIELFARLINTDRKQFPATDALKQLTLLWVSRITSVTFNENTVISILAIHLKILGLYKTFAAINLNLPGLTNHLQAISEASAYLAVKLSKYARKLGKLNHSIDILIRYRNNTHPSLFIEKANLQYAQGNRKEAIDTLSELLNQVDKCPVPESFVFDRQINWRDQAHFKLLMHKCKKDLVDTQAMKDELKRFKANQRYTKKSMFAIINICFNEIEDAITNQSHNTKVSDIVFDNWREAAEYSLKLLPLGSKYLYQYLPKLMGFWLEHHVHFTDRSKKAESCAILKKIASEAAPYQLLPIMNQLVSRIHQFDPVAQEVFSKILGKLISEYPEECFWINASNFFSEEEDNEKRKVALKAIFKKDLDDAKYDNVSKVWKQFKAFYEFLKKICAVDFSDKRHPLVDLSGLDEFGTNFSYSFRLKIPTQQFLHYEIPDIPPSEVPPNFSPFPVDCPFIKSVNREVIVLSSKEKPALVTFNGSDGKPYRFLFKRNDNLNKDAFINQFFQIINRMLENDLNAQQYNLGIRTYMALPFSPRLGIIEWVEDTKTISNAIKTTRPIDRDFGKELLSFQDIRGKSSTFNIPNKKDVESFKKFCKEMPPTFNRWFEKSFLGFKEMHQAKFRFTASLAVMSIVGYIIGLGDRHLDNILIDEKSGQVIHIDFDAIFEHGSHLKVPERMPFRLTQNLVDVMGVFGADALFRSCCVTTLRVLQDNGNELRTFFKSMVYDPSLNLQGSKIPLPPNHSKIKDNRNYLGIQDRLYFIASESLAPTAPDPLPSTSEALPQPPSLAPNSLTKSVVKSTMFIEFVLFRFERKVKGIIQSKALSAEAMVDELIFLAQDYGILASAYVGWRSYI